MLRSLATRFISGSVILAFGLVVPISARGAAPQPNMPRSEKHESRHEIDQMEEEWKQAALKSNTAIMESLLADDYMAITASGTLQNKDETLTNLRSGKMHFNSLDLSERKVRFYGTTAVVTSIAKVTGVTPEGDMTGSYRYTRVYVREQNGRWKIVSFEASRIREPGDRK